MRTALRVLFYLIAAEVLVQGAAMGYAIVRFGEYANDHGISKGLLDQNNANFPGSGAFGIHFLNGMMVIPVIVLVILIVSLFSKVAGATKRAGILLGLVVLQVFLGLFSHSAAVLILLHVPNAFVIFSFAAVTAWRLSNDVVAVDAPRETASV